MKLKNNQITQDIFSKYVHALHSTKSIEGKEIFGQMAADAIVYLSSHSGDPCNMYLGSCITSSFLKTSFLQFDGKKEKGTKYEDGGSQRKKKKKEMKREGEGMISQNGNITIQQQQQQQTEQQQQQQQQFEMKEKREGEEEVAQLREELFYLQGQIERWRMLGRHPELVCDEIKKMVDVSSSSSSQRTLIFSFVAVRMSSLPPSYK